MVKYNAQIIAYGKSNSLFSPLSVDGCSNTLSSKRRANQHVNVVFLGQEPTFLVITEDHITRCRKSVKADVYDTESRTSLALIIPSFYRSRRHRH